MNIAFIAAKGHSTRIPRKNKKLFHGKPIIAYSIETAFASGLFDHVIVSTDDPEIAAIAELYGAETMHREPRWTQDDVGPLDVAWNSLKELEDVKLICCIYPTAPLMSVSDLTIGYGEVMRHGVAYSVSIGVEPLHDAAQFFWCKPWALRDRVPEFGSYTVMIPIDPSRDCDINIPEDWSRAEELYRRLHA